MRYWILSALLLVGCLFSLAPGFLCYADLPRKTDAVVLFVGPGNISRRDEAQQLIKDGYARYLLIPSSGELFAPTPGGGLKRLAGRPKGELFFRLRMAASYGKHYENTHVEALEAKRMMDDLGLTSAMLVSSAYHMRRIGMIAGRVFDSRKYAISCNPPRWQKDFTMADWLDKEHRQAIVSEYVKMGWFLVYEPFGSGKW